MPSAFDVLAKGHEEVKTMLAELERGPTFANGANEDQQPGTGTPPRNTGSSPGINTATARTTPDRTAVGDAPTAEIVACGGERVIDSRNPAYDPAGGTDRCSARLSRMPR